MLRITISISKRMLNIFNHYNIYVYICVWSIFLLLRKKKQSLSYKKHKNCSKKQQRNCNSKVVWKGGRSVKQHPIRTREKTSPVKEDCGLWRKNAVISYAILKTSIAHHTFWLHSSALKRLHSREPKHTHTLDQTGHTMHFHEKKWSAGANY